jgi:tricorn protease-like protein
MPGVSIATFSTTTMHSVDWPAMRQRYSGLLEDCASPEDANCVIGQMIAGLNISYARIGMAGDVEQIPRVSVELLGVDFDLHNGTYRIAKIYEGAPWDADARGPLSQPGCRFSYLLLKRSSPSRCDQTSNLLSSASYRRGCIPSHRRNFYQSRWKQLDSHDIRRILTYFTKGFGMASLSDVTALRLPHSLFSVSISD